MHRRAFLATTALGSAALGVPGDPARSGHWTHQDRVSPAPHRALRRHRHRPAARRDPGHGAGQRAGRLLGRQIEVLFRDDQLKPAVGAQRTKELIENEKVDFIVGGLAAHVQMAINEQTKAAGKLFISISQSDEISAKPDSSPLTFHEALNPTITGRAVGGWAVKNLGKAWWIVYADYAWGKQNDAVFTAVVEKAGGKIIGHTPYPLGKPEFSTHMPQILAAKPEVVLAATPGSDSVAFFKQAISFGLKKQTKLLVPLHFLSSSPRRAGPISSRTSTAAPASTGSSRARSRRPRSTSRPSRSDSRRRPTRIAATGTAGSWRSCAASSWPSPRTRMPWPRP